MLVERETGHRAGVLGRLPIVDRTAFARRPTDDLDLGDFALIRVSGGIPLCWGGVGLCLCLGSVVLGGLGGLALVTLLLWRCGRGFFRRSFHLLLAIGDRSRRGLGGVGVGGVGGGGLSGGVGCGSVGDLLLALSSVRGERLPLLFGLWARVVQLLDLREVVDLVLLPAKVSVLLHVLH